MRFPIWLAICCAAGSIAAEVQNSDPALAKPDRVIGSDYQCEALSFLSSDQIVAYVTGSGVKVIRWPKEENGGSLKIANPGLGPLATAASGLIALGGPEQKSILLWVPSKKEAITAISSRGPTFDVLAFSPQADLLAAGDHNGSAFIFRIPEGTVTAELKGHIGTVWALAWTPNGHKLATASADNDVCIWDVPSGRLTTRIESLSYAPFAITWSVDGRYLYLGGASGKLTKWDTTNNQLSQEAQKQTSLIQAIALSPDGALIAAGGLHAEGWQKTANLSVYDAATLQRKADFPAHQGAVTAICFTPDGKSIISASDVEPGLKVWSLQTVLNLSKTRGE